MRVLLTNDDGVHAEGLHHLAAAVAALGHDVVVVAPLHEMSGSGASTGPLQAGTEFSVGSHEIAGLDGISVHSVDGPPALCVMAARLGGFGAVPELVVSGINPGMNTGRGCLHSGTVGAALTAQAFGMSALAVSLDVASGNPHWPTAARAAQVALGWLIDAPRRTVLNVNAPDRPPGDVAGVRWARLGATSGSKASLVSASQGRLRLELTPIDLVLKADTDTARVHAGYISVTTLRGVAAEDEVPLAEALESAFRSRS